MKKNKKEQVRFQSKEIKQKGNMNEDYKSVITLVIVLIVIGCLVALVYFLNGKYVTKDHFQSTTSTTAKVIFDETVITVDNMFDIDKNEYYVLLFDAKDETSAFLYSGLVTSFKEDKIPLYSIDLSNAMNKKYYDKEGKVNKSPKKASDVLVTGPTLITIKKGKVSSFITEKEKIVEKLS